MTIHEAKILLELLDDLSRRASVGGIQGRGTTGAIPMPVRKWYIKASKMIHRRILDGTAYSDNGWEESDEVRALNHDCQYLWSVMSEQDRAYCSRYVRELNRRIPALGTA